MILAVASGGDVANVLLGPTHDAPKCSLLECLLHRAARINPHPALVDDLVARLGKMRLDRRSLEFAVNERNSEEIGGDGRDVRNSNACGGVSECGACGVDDLLLGLEGSCLALEFGGPFGPGLLSRPSNVSRGEHHIKGNLAPIALNLYL